MKFSLWLFFPTNIGFIWSEMLRILFKWFSFSAYFRHISLNKLDIPLSLAQSGNMQMYISIYTYTYIYIYMYIELSFQWGVDHGLDMFSIIVYFLHVLRKKLLNIEMILSNNIIFAGSATSFYTYILGLTILATINVSNQIFTRTLL